MKFYIGGAWQGQEELARRENPTAEIIVDFHECIRNALTRGEDPCRFTEHICTTHPMAVIVANEIGAGIVPLDVSERIFREAVGRALCIVAQRSEEVTRVVCGIGVRIK